MDGYKIRKYTTFDGKVYYKIILRVSTLYYIELFGIYRTYEQAEIELNRLCKL